MRARSLGFVAAATFVSAAWATTPPSFTSIEITSLGGPQGNITAAGINSHGDIAGVSQYPAGSPAPGNGPFIYHHSNGVTVPLQGTAVGGLNDGDAVAGVWVNPSPEAVVWSKNGGVQVLPSNGFFAEAAAISNDGDVVGNIDNGHFEGSAVMWTSRPSLHMISLGVLWDDPSLPGYATSSAIGINRFSHITGTSSAGKGTTPDTAVPYGAHAFLYRDGKMTDLGALALSNDGSDDSEGMSINNLDQVVGISNTAIPELNTQGNPCPDCGMARHAVLWSAGKMQDLGTLSFPGWDSQADSINDSGEIVGLSSSIVNGAETNRAFLYVGGQMLNLQFYIYDRDPNVRLTEAVGINCQGWIVANGFNTTSPNVQRTYLLIRRGPPRTQCGS
jgi:probable HAF family extracellular repeat protein